MSVLEAKILVSPTSEVDVFETGKFEVTTSTVRTSNNSKPPVELFIVTPSVTKGTFPVLLFCHGFMLTNTWYTKLFEHIASHGYIVVAPKFYGLFSISIPEEIKRAAQVAKWLSNGLPLELPENVIPDMDNLALSGHSRGGKTAFALALGEITTTQKNYFKNYFKNCFKKTRSTKVVPPTIRNDQSPVTFKALIGIDPVAGTAPSDRPLPKILQYIPRCFDMSIPVAVIGTGYGNQYLGLIPPFAPDGVNHSEFFNESKPPVCYFLTKDYGHCDMLDDWIADYMRLFCKSGEGPRDLMRKGVGGIVVAFLRARLGGEEKSLNAIVEDPSIAPLTLDPVIYVKE